MTTRNSPLPGGEFVEKGVEDLARGDITVEALLVAVASVRLRELGLPVPAEDRLPPEREIALYRMVGRDHPNDAYSRYRSLLRRLASYVHALEAEVGRAIRRARSHY